MDLAEYELTGRHGYAELASTVARIIETISRNSTDYRIQQVQARAKGVASLRSKLAARNVLDTDVIENEVKDLAGCRVILYTNADVARFISSAVISDNFEVDWDRTKFHYPMSEPTAEDGFISYNYVVQLKPDRLALAEYAPFKGMWCEVQVQTALDHAWSEMAHDTIYKPPPPGFGSAVMKSVEERMTSIIQQHLRPAGFEFQKVAADVRELEKGRELLAQDPLKLLEGCQDNNERHEILKEFAEFVLPYYDNPAEVGPVIRAAVLGAAKKARATSTVPWTALGHTFEGVEADRVVSQALDIIDELRFTDQEAITATFDALAELLPDAGASETDRILKSAERLAKHELGIWRRAGPVVEARLLDHIEALSSEARERVRPLVVKVLRYVLEPDVTGHSSTFSAITIHQGAVVASDEYLTLRRRAIAQLEDLLLSSQSEVDQRLVLDALNTAGRLPDHGQLSAELVAATLGDTRKIIEFVTGHIGHLSYEVRQALEHDLLWRYRRNRVLPFDFRADAGLLVQREALEQAILKLRDLLNEDEEFVAYKTLVGFESVFPMEWEGDGVDFEAEQAYRLGEIKRLVGEVSDGNFDAWVATIRRCAQTKSKDGATFPSFRNFLVELGKEKPALLVRLFDQVDEDLDWFVGSMLLGLEGGPLAEEIERRITTWLGEGKHLVQILHFLSAAKAMDATLLRRALTAAIAAGDETAVSLAMEIAVKRDEETDGGLLDVFESGLAYLDAEQSTRWVNNVWYHTRDSDFLTRLPAATQDAVLANLVHARRIDTHDEEVLNAVAGGQPLKLLQFFHERLLCDSEPSYDALPYKFYRLEDRLGAVPTEVVAAVRQWFDENDELFEYRAGSLPSKIFPEFLAIEQPLRELVQAGGRRDLEFVLAVLAGYEGEVFLHPICKDIVGQLEPDDTLLRKVSYVLDQSGTLSGEYGLVELYCRRQDEVLPWLSDERPAVREFAERRRQQFDLRIAAEQRRSRESVEFRKRHYGE